MKSATALMGLKQWHPGKLRVSPRHWISCCWASGSVGTLHPLGFLGAVLFSWMGVLETFRKWCHTWIFFLLQKLYVNYLYNVKSTSFFILVPKDPKPQWRRVAWSYDCTLLAYAESMWTVRVFDLMGSELFVITPVCTYPKNCLLSIGTWMNEWMWWKRKYKSG